MTTFWIIVAVIVAIIIVIWVFSDMITAATSDETVVTPRPEIYYLNREGDCYEDKFNTYIAGINYRCNLSDIGGFSGWVEPEPDNRYDKKAMAIYSGKKHIGYIPADELHEYRAWSDCKTLPCCGYIYREDGEYRGRIKVIIPCNADFVRQELRSYQDWVRENVGSDYVPPLFPVDFRVPLSGE